jgi:hypothetical protein
MRSANDDQHGEVVHFIRAERPTAECFPIKSIEYVQRDEYLKAHRRRQFVADMMTGAGFVFFILGCMAMASDVFG